MAKLLRVNGIEAPVLVDSASHKPNPFAESERAEDGSMLINRRVIKESYRLTLAHRTPTEAIAWRRYLMGEGHYWSFDTSVYSSKGLGPSLLTGGTIGSSSPAPWLGAGRLNFALGAGNQANFGISPGVTQTQGVTAMVARNVAGGGWNHYVKDSAGNVWTNGVLTGTASWFNLTTIGGLVNIGADAGNAIAYDELVILPFLIPSDWPAQLYAYQLAGSQHSALAQLKVDGDLVDANLLTRTVVGSVGDMKLMPATLGGTFYQSVRTVDVELEEV